MKTGTSLRGICRWQAPMLAAALSVAAMTVARAQSTDPNDAEWANILKEYETSSSPKGDQDGQESSEDLTRPPEEEGLAEPGETDDKENGQNAIGGLNPELPPGDDSRRMTGADARRELLFQDGLDEREFRYPKGLEPAPPIERSDPQAFDARYRGRNAQVLDDATAGLTVDASVSAGMRVDDNPRLITSAAPENESSDTWGWFVEPRLAVTRRTARTLLQGVIRLPYDDFNSFEGDANNDLGSFDQYAGLQLDVLGQTNAFNLFTNIANSTTRTAVVEETGEDLSGDRALTYGGGGSFKHSVTANSVVQFSAAARRQELDTPQLQDSTFYQLALDYRMLLNRADALGLGAIYEKFLPDEPEFGDGILFESSDVRIITALANWSRRVNASMNFLVEGGAQIITSENGSTLTETGTKVGPYINASLYWGLTNRDSVLFGFEHSALPTAAGEVRITNQLDVSYQRELTRTMAVAVPLLIIFQNESFENDFDNRTFVQFSPNFIWTFSPDWALSGEYRFRLNDVDSGSATSNSVFMWLTWFSRLAP